MPYIPDGTVLELQDRLPWRPSLWDRLRGRTQEPEAGLSHVRAFGWLSAAHHFTTGTTPVNLLDTLALAAHERIWVMRGYHVSEFAADQPIPLPFETQHGTLLLGDASLLVVDDEGEPWVAPNLVLHYVRDAHYAPPFTPHLPSDELLAAVSRFNPPTSPLLKNH